MESKPLILIAVTLAFFMFSSSAAAQAVIFNYTIHVDFFAFSCSLSVGQVLFYDPSGNLVGYASSPTGGEVAVDFRTTAPLSTLTVTANGVATYDSYYSWAVSGTRSIILSGSGDYWLTIRMS